MLAVRISLGVVLLAAIAPASAQSRFIIADRNQDALHVLYDVNGNGVIDEPEEVRTFFSGANSNGTLGPQNPTSLAVGPGGWVVFGDQLNRAVYFLRDHDFDGNAQGIGESIVAADASNGSGASFAFPTGVEFDPRGVPYVTNAGNAFGPDMIYRLEDLDGDWRVQSPGEITEYVGEFAFGPGNGPFSPQELFYDANGVGFLRDSATNTRGIYRFEDLNSDGRADGPGEFTLFFDGTNASGVPLLAGFALEPDRVRPNAMYTLQVATGGVDQLLRVQDLNGNGNAQDVGEAALVFATAEANFTAIDIVSLYDGSVLMTDNSGKVVIRLTDLDGDGNFMGPGERSAFFANTLGLVTDIRQIAIYPLPADLDANGKVEGADALFFFDCLGGPDAPGACDPARSLASDLSWDGAVDLADAALFQQLYEL